MIPHSEEIQDVNVFNSGATRTHLFRPAEPGRFPGMHCFSEIYQFTVPICRLERFLTGLNHNGIPVAAVF